MARDLEARLCDRDAEERQRSGIPRPLIPQPLEGSAIGFALDCEKEMKKNAME